MTNATFKKVNLNGEDHVLKYDFNAISELEEYYQKGIHAIVTEESVGFNTVRSILWAGLLWKNPQLKVHHVGTMLENEMNDNDEFDLNEWMEITIKALYESKAFKLISKSAKKSEAKN
jgi:hypothetical protein